jgi:hypothetical protein
MYESLNKIYYSMIYICICICRVEVVTSMFYLVEVITSTTHFIEVVISMFYFVEVITSINMLTSIQHIYI